MTLSERDYYDRYLGFDDVGVFRALGDRTSVASAISRRRKRSGSRRSSATSRSCFRVPPPPSDGWRRRCRSRSHRARSARDSARAGPRDICRSFSSRSWRRKTRRTASRRRIPICTRLHSWAPPAAVNSSPGECVAIEDSPLGTRIRAHGGVKDRRRHPYLRRATHCPPISSSRRSTAWKLDRSGRSVPFKRTAILSQSKHLDIRAESRHFYGLSALHPLRPLVILVCPGQRSISHTVRLRDLCYPRLEEEEDETSSNRSGTRGAVRCELAGERAAADR